MPAWMGFHVFYHDYLRHDDLLLDGILPMVRELMQSGQAERWFFLRYWEGGPHLRVRVCGSPDSLEQVVKPTVTRKLAAYMAAHPVAEVDRQAFYQAHPLDGEKPEDLSALPWYPNHSVQELPYVPEYRRYGGESGLRVSEELFCDSSELAVRLVRATRGDRQKRLSLALDVMVLTALGLGIAAETLCYFFELYTRIWARFLSDIQQVKERAAAHPGVRSGSLRERTLSLGRWCDGQPGSPQPALYRTWWETVCRRNQAFRRLEEEGRLEHPWGLPSGSAGHRFGAIAAIGISHLHMTNNRLGFSPAEEAFLSALIWQALLPSGDRVAN